MSTYTTQVRFIVEEAAGLEKSVGYSKVEETIAKALPSVFDFDFPIFDEAYRSVLETKILKHYYTREICAETVGLWKLWLNTRLNEIMPYYNQLYKSELLEYNPLYDYDLWRTHKLTRDEKVDDKGSSNLQEDTVLNQNINTKEDGSSSITNNSESDTTQTSNTTENSKDRYSETPQGQVHLLENNDYLTNARIIDRGVDVSSEGKVTGEDTSEGTTHNTGSNITKADTSRTNDVSTSNVRQLNSLDDYIEHVSGKSPGKSYAQMIAEFRNTFLNIDMLIINDLKDLFFGLW